MADTVHPLLRPWVLALDYSDEPPFGSDYVYDYDLRDPDGTVVDSLTFCGLTTGYLESMVNAHLPKHGMALLVFQGTAIEDLSGSKGPPFNAFADHPEGIRWLQRPDQHEFFARCVAKRKNTELDFDAMPTPVLRDWLIDNGLEEYADFAYRLDAKPPIKSISVEGRRWYSRAKGCTYHAADVTVTDHAGEENRYTAHARIGYGESYRQSAFKAMSQEGWPVPGDGILAPHYWCRQRGIEYSESVQDVKRKMDL